MTESVPQIGIKIVNDSGQVIPPRSIVVVTSVTMDTANFEEGKTVNHAVQYNGQAGNIFVTGAQAIAVGKRGSAYSDQFIYVGIDPSVGSTSGSDASLNPLSGEMWGPIPGSWTVGRGGIGFFAQGYVENNGSYKRAMFRRDSGFCYAKIISGLSAGTFENPTQCVVNIWTKDPNNATNPRALIQAINSQLLGLVATNRGCWSGSSSSSSSSSNTGIACRLEYDNGEFSLLQIFRCTTVVTDASCAGGSLVVTKGMVQG